MENTKHLTYHTLVQKLTNGEVPEPGTKIAVSKAGHPLSFEDRLGHVDYMVVDEKKFHLMRGGSTPAVPHEFAIVTGKIELSGSKIEKAFHATGTIFLNEFQASGSQFAAEVDFTHAVFLDRVDFTGCSFLSDATFRNTHFLSHGDFRDAIFDAHADFRQTLFQLSGNFRNTVFRDRSDFSKSHFHGDFYADGSKFHESATFVACRFDHLAYFDNATFANQADFRNGKFHGKAIFSEATFDSMVHFTESAFDEPASFRTAAVHAWVDFTHTQFRKFADLNELTLREQGSLLFRQTLFNEQALLSLKIAEGKVLFDKTDIRQEFHFPIEDLRKVHFSPLILFEENGAPDLTGTEENFRLLQKIYRSTGALENELDSRYHFKRFENMRQNQNRPVRRFLRWFMLDLTSRYFTNWSRVLISMGVVFLIFFGLYCAFPGHIVLDGKSLTESNLSAADHLRNIAYFSLITFTTIGYGDIHPNGFLQIFAGIEGFIGIFLNSMFMVTLAKRILG